jgi:hypothetical protein
VGLGLALRRAGLDGVAGRARGRVVLADAAKKFADDARVLHAAGAAILEDGDAAAARPLLETAAARAPWSEASVALAAARRLTGDAAGAAQAASDALHEKNGDPEAQLELGLARLDLADGPGARAALEAARTGGIDVDPRLLEEAKRLNGGAPP